MMKKSCIGLFIVLFSMIVLTGCGESQKDSAIGAASEKESLPVIHHEPTDDMDQSPAEENETASEQLKPVGTQPLVKSDDPDRPIIVIEQPVHDFGDIGPKTKNTCRFKFTNTGVKPLIITQKPHSTCGCSVPKLFKDGQAQPVISAESPMEFKTGESGEMEVTYTAGSYKSKVSKDLYILTNDPEQPSAQVTIKANIVVNVDMQPENVDLALNLPNAGMSNLVLKSTDGVEFSIQTIKVTGDCFKIDFDPAKKATEFVLTPVVDLVKLDKTLNGSITVTVDHPKAGMMVSRFNTKPAYEVQRPTIILQNLQQGQEYIKDNRITSNYGNKIEVESITSRDGFAEVIDQQLSADGLVLDFKVKVVTPQTRETKRRLFTDELTIKLKDGTEHKVRVNGWYKLR